jgi:DNA/RNA-binding protein KIN17
MCEKQCRDENGFRCHINSEGHQRQMLLFAGKSGKFIEDFSKQFMNGFLQILQRRYSTTRVFANQVYQEYISDRNHLHMNATRWATLTEFCYYLSRRGFVKVDETEKGPWLTWIDNSPQELQRRDAIRKMEALKKDQEERDRLIIEEQIKKNSGVEENPGELEALKLDRSKPVSLSLPGEFKKSLQKSTKPLLVKKASVFEDDEEEHSSASKPLNQGPSEMSQQQDSIQDDNEDEPWIIVGIVVKILSEKLADGAYFEKKGVIINVHDDYVAEIEVVDSGDVIRLDQTFLETVIPKIRGKVLILRKPLRGTEAVLDSIDETQYCATLSVKNSSGEQEIIKGMDFEWFSKKYE